MSMTSVSSEQRDADHERQMSLVRQAELLISNVLRGGVLVSAAVILVGVALYYLHPQPTTADALSYPNRLGEIIPGVLAGSAEAIIT
ncbi:MAG TPA: DUF1634 domain-containing protein, partial [Ktedonobacterales bacterium]